MSRKRKSGCLARHNRWIPSREYDTIRRKLPREYQGFVELLRRTGFRVDDALHSRWADWRRGPVAVLRESKTGNLRGVWVTEEIKAALKLLPGYDRAPDDAYILSGARGRPGDAPRRHRSTVYRTWIRAVRAAGMEGRGYTIHSLRKMYARDRYNALGGDLGAVQRDLGHKNIATTILYLSDF